MTTPTPTPSDAPISADDIRRAHDDIPMGVARITHTVMGRPSTWDAAVIRIDGDTLYSTIDGVWFSMATRSATVSWVILPTSAYGPLTPAPAPAVETATDAGPAIVAAVETSPDGPVWVARWIASGDGITSAPSRDMLMWALTGMGIHPDSVTPDIPTPAADDDTPRATVHSVRHVGTMASRAHYSATVSYPGETARNVSFIGASTPGYPGPVMMRTHDGSDWVRVDSPARFGDDFGPAWVRAFFGA